MLSCWLVKGYGCGHFGQGLIPRPQQLPAQYAIFECGLLGNPHRMLLLRFFQNGVETDAGLIGVFPHNAGMRLNGDADEDKIDGKNDGKKQHE